MGRRALRPYHFMDLAVGSGVGGKSTRRCVLRRDAAGTRRRGRPRYGGDGSWEGAEDEGSSALAGAGGS